MEIKVNLEISFSPATITVLQGLFQSGTAQVTIWKNEKQEVQEEIKVEKPAKEKKEKATPAPAATPAQAVKTEPKANSTKIDLSTIRQHLAKSDANKDAARALFPKFGVSKLTELNEKDFAEFYNTLVAGVDDSNDL